MSAGGRPGIIVVTHRPEKLPVRDHRRRRARRLRAVRRPPGCADLRPHRDRRRFEGRGLASILIPDALDDVRAHGLTIVPQCPFVRAYVDRHPEVTDLLAPGVPAPLPGGHALTFRVVVWGTGNAGPSRDPRRGRAPRPRARRRGRRRSRPRSAATRARSPASVRWASLATDDLDGRARRRRRRRRLHRDRRHPSRRRARRSRAVSRSRPQRGVDLVLRAPAPAHRAASVLDVVDARVPTRQLVGVRVRHRPGLGARHPPRARERRRRRDHRDPRAGAVQLRALRPARGRPRGHRLRRPDGPAAADAARHLAADGVGADAAPARRLPRARARRRHHARRAPRAGADDRGPGHGDVRGRHAGCVPLRGPRRRSATACRWWSST